MDPILATIITAFALLSLTAVSMQVTALIRHNHQK